MTRRLVAAAIVSSFIALGCGSEGESEEEEDGEVPFSVRIDPAGIDAPRGNFTERAVVTVSRKPGFTAEIGIIAKGLPKEIRAIEPDFRPGDDRGAIRILAQSDAPTGTYQAEIIAISVEESGKSWEVQVGTLLVTPTDMERLPNSDFECAAHWGPIIRGTGNADGWKAISRLKDGEPGELPDELYKEWWFSYEPQDDAYFRYYAREILVPSHPEGKTKGGRVLAMMGFDENRGCRLSVEPFDRQSIDPYLGNHRSWNFVDHRVGAPSQEQLIIGGQSIGIDTKYIKPVYEFTLVRAQLPPLEP